MKTLRSFALLTASLLLACSVMASAQAALIHNLTTQWGSGQITFINDNGGTDVNDVEAFSFDVNAGSPGGPQSYNENDIASIGWSIAQDWSLSLKLSTNLVTFGEGVSGLNLNNALGTVPNSCVPAFQATATQTCALINNLVTTQLGTLTTQAVHVPEPPTSLLFAVGVVSLFWLRRRRSAPCRRRVLGDFV